ncbi:hypothetical protein [Frateuria aurantia]|uniref:HNH endonuclease 5 domain-containing protein n=1 Tax=Frateuria aurantia (strain ATCC 33424 / DSM 6220 / KCTC 2777 / LMG 1558 / NBRC 3245 / NCIMB 13370) TaxID=767434 RepID=H8L1U2_FRAAD|nr:hypothetical protein [Frateuria aurantia]AFC86353.1 hypothetical protein Fraau_1965 [Frateuria aurantia DSM 6220]
MSENNKSTAFNDKYYEEHFNLEFLPKKCMLCQSGSLNRKGHLIPKFISTQIKKKLDIPTLRYSTVTDQGLINEGRHRQDTLALQFLCDNCENRLGLAESAFSNSQFRPRLEGAQIPDMDRLTHDFITSIAWKYATFNSFKKVGSNSLSRIEPEIEKARKYLAGEQESNPFDIYFINLERVSEVMENTDSNRFLYNITLRDREINPIQLIGDTWFPGTSSGIPIITVRLGPLCYIIAPSGHLHLLRCMPEERPSPHNIVELEVTQDIINLLISLEGGFIDGIPSRINNPAMEYEMR